MQAFHRLFSGKANASTLSAELNAQIITVRECRQTKMSVTLWVLVLKITNCFISVGFIWLFAQWEWPAASAGLAGCYGESPRPLSEVMYCVYSQLHNSTSAFKGLFSCLKSSKWIIFLSVQPAELSEYGPPASSVLCCHVLPPLHTHTSGLCSHQHTQGKEMVQVEMPHWVTWADKASQALSGLPLVILEYDGILNKFNDFVSHLHCIKWMFQVFF